MEVIYSNAVSREVERMRSDFCCGCKIRDQDCFMLDEYETWQMYGLNAIEQVNETDTLWSEFIEVTRVFELQWDEHVFEHWKQMKRESDPMLVESLMNAQNHEVQSTLNQLSHLYGHDPLESGGTVYFTNPPTFNYTVKDNMGTV